MKICGYLCVVEAVESKLVKLETSCTVILTQTMSVLCMVEKI